MTRSQIFLMLFLLVSTVCLTVDGCRCVTNDSFYYSFVVRVWATLAAWGGFIYVVAL